MDPTRTAEILRRQATRERADREAVAASIRERVADAVRKRLPRGGRAWLIGSLAWGTFGPHSDVDLVLDGVASAVAVEIEMAVAKAANAPVDVLDYSALPDSFRTRIEVEGVALDAE